MARYQYRIAGELTWQSNSGNALLALSNRLDSGKKVTLRALELTPLSSTTTGTAGSVSAGVATALTLARVAIAGGTEMAPVEIDTDASAWPASVRLMRMASYSGTPEPLSRVFLLKQLNQASLSWMGRQAPVALSRLWSRPRKDAAVEGLVVRAGESVALYVSALRNSIPVRVTATIVRDGSPDHIYVARFFTSLLAQDQVVFGIENTVGSGETVILRDVSVEEVGTYDSPYLQLVPHGGVIEATASEAPTILRMDTANPDPLTWVEARLDAPVLPAAPMPENAFSDASAGSPKGFNYLKTKDFLGPAFRVAFPEYISDRPAAAPDCLRAAGAMRFADLGVRKAGITIREGEGIAIVSAAETAAGATAAVGVSGWSSWEFAVVFDVEPKIAPVLTLTGLKNPSEVRVFEGGTTNEVAGQEDVTTGSFSWTFDPEETPTVDIAILSLGYQNMRFLGVALGLADVSIPVQQQVDRQYANT